MKLKTVLAVLILLSMFSFYPVAKPAFALTVEEMSLKLKCPDDQESLDHQHGCKKHREMADLLERLVSENKTEEQILDTFVATYGITSVVDASNRGFGLLSYIVPMTVLGVALILFLAFTNKKSKIEPDAAGSSAQAGIEKTDYESRFEHEYNDFKENG